MIDSKNRYGLTEDFVARGPSPSQVIVVQRREIIVDERIGVQHLERGAQVFNSRWKGSGDHPSGFQAQNRPQALAARENTVPHGLMNRHGMLRGWRQQAFQGRVSQRTAGLQCVIEHDAEYSKRALRFA